MQSAGLQPKGLKNVNRHGIRWRAILSPLNLPED